jgi:hypothetical protein
MLILVLIGYELNAVSHPFLHPANAAFEEAALPVVQHHWTGGFFDFLMWHHRPHRRGMALKILLFLGLSIKIG